MTHGANSPQRPPCLPGEIACLYDVALRVSLCVSLLTCAFHCGGSQRQPGGLAAPSEPAADPSAKVMIQSSSRPDRSATAEDPGREVAKELLAPVSDCELTMCTGDVPSQLVESIRARAAEARSCYEAALKSNSTLAGRVVIAVRVTREGKACSIKPVQNELSASTMLLPCLRALLERSYPKPVNGCVDLNLPLNFVPEFVELDGGVASDPSRR